MKMSISQKLTVMVATVLTLAVGFGGTVSAIGEGQIAGGNIYNVRNVTKGGDYATSIGADKCDTLKYSLRLHNPGPGVVNNVNVRATLPTNQSSTNVSTATVTSQNSEPATVSDTATVNISTPQKVEYIAGSSVLLDANGAVLQTLPDQLVNGSGVNIGEVRVSLEQIRFVQFQAKIDCSVTPPPCVDNPSTPEDECNPCVDDKKTPQDECNPVTPETPVTPGTTTSTPSGSEGVSELANTGAGGFAGIVTAAIAAGIVGFRYYLGRRFSS